MSDMTTTNDLPARLLEHAAAHEELAAYYEPPAAHQAQWARDLRDAASALELVRWRDIATAPEDYETFNAWIVADDGFEWFEPDCYLDEDGIIRDGSGTPTQSAHQRATHWMPPIAGPSAGA